MSVRSEKRKGKRLTVWVFVLYVLLLAGSLLFLIDGRHVRFYMNGSTSMEMKSGRLYEEPGCSAVSVGRLFGEGWRDLPVAVRGEVDCFTPGGYELEYSARWFLWRYSTVRTVRVVDVTPPIITLSVTEDYTPSWFTGYQEEGFSAWDDCDGDVTDRVERKVYDDRIEYVVSDAAGNRATAVRELNYSLGRPTITLTGGEDVELPAALTFSDPGYQALDENGNDLTQYVRVEGEVIPSRTGSYVRVYRIENGRGDSVSVTRQIRIVPAYLPETVMPEEPTIYLTFDDGPGPYTERLLDVLAEYGVKATFFVTCRYPDYLDMVGRAFREGHSIGVHTASHNYYEIYDSEEAFYEDFIRAEQMIYDQTGSYTTIFRFPGGSSNTVSSFNYGIMTRLADAMHAMGYQYFDWNVDSGDAGGTTRTNQVFQNIRDGCWGRRVCVVLQHDIKDYSVAAVEQVIQWGLANGYRFAALDMSSPVAHHGIAN